MRAPEDFLRIVGRKRYFTKTSLLIAGDDYWDGHNYERRGRNRFLYRTKKGNYFVVTLTQWLGEADRLEPLTMDEAIELYEGPLTEQRVSYEEAFPGVTVSDA